MTETETRNRLGRILSAIGYVWIALFFVARSFNFGGTPLGDILAFFGSNLLLPLILLFVGRSMRRRSRRVSMEDALDSHEDLSEQQSQATPPPTPRPPQSRPTPPPPPPPPVESAPVDIDELAEAIGFDDSDQTSSLSDSEVEKAGPKTSAEMIAEAHRRFNKDD